VGIEKRWLKWNATYDLAGICNRPLSPLDPGPDQIKAIKERLYLLGFDCGALDAAMNDETKKSLRTFNGYWNHPIINRLTDPVVLPPAVPAPLTAPFFDNDTTNVLHQMEDEHQSIKSPAVQQLALTTATLQVTRNRIGRSGYSTTINRATPLAVKIVSSPSSLSPFAFYAMIQLEFKGFEKIQSLLFRIYRNYENDHDKISASGDKLIYQEILDRESVLNLARRGPKDNLGKHHEAKAFIMKNEYTGGFGGFFNSSLGIALEKLHAPYKVRVWVSSINGFFDTYAFNQTTAIPSSRKIFSESDNLHYLDSAKRSDVRRGRTKTLSGAAPADNSYANEPDLNHMDSVHDKSFFAWIDKSESVSLKTHWSDFVKWNSALKREKLWTGNDERGVNIIDEACGLSHDARFLIDNQIQEETFPIDFAKDPTGIYLELREKMDLDEPNFKLPELAEVYANIERHINLIKRRLCCGQWRHLDESIKNDVLPFIDAKILPEIKHLEGAGFPYNDSILFCEKFISFFSLIVHHAVVKPELSFFQNFDLQKTSQPPLDPNSMQHFPFWLRDRRNRVDGCRSTAGSEYGISTGHRFHTSQGTPEKAFVAISNTDSYPQLQAEIRKVQGARNIGKPILIPSYNPLDPYFFVRIRAVPMFAIGMLDMQYLNADGIRQIPVGFFEHDMFHVCTPGTGVQQWKTLYKRLCDVIDANPGIADKARAERLVYVKWQENVDKITAKIDSFSGVRREAFAFLLFWLLHEPKTGIIPPALPEPKEMTNRITQQDPTGIELVLKTIKEEDQIDFFGTYSHPFMQHMNWAATQYAFLATELEDAA
jgi:hypothetical protein